MERRAAHTPTRDELVRDQALIGPPPELVDFSMPRSRERVIDLAATALLLVFAWLFNDETPGLSGVVIAAAIQFWLNKNATDSQRGSDGRPQ
jgi:hypothetical protein